MDFYKYLKESPNKEILAKRIAILKTLKTECVNRLKQEKTVIEKLNSSYLQQYSLYVYKTKKYNYKNNSRAINLLIEEELLDFLEPVSQKKRYLLYKQIESRNSSDEETQTQLMLENKLQAFKQINETISLNLLKKGKSEEVKEEFYKLYNNITINGSEVEKYLQLKQIKSDLSLCLKNCYNSLIKEKEYINIYRFFTLKGVNRESYEYTDETKSSYKQAIEALITYLQTHKISLIHGLKLKQLTSSHVALLKERNIYDELITLSINKIITTTPFIR